MGLIVRSHLLNNLCLILFFRIIEILACLRKLKRDILFANTLLSHYYFIFVLQCFVSGGKRADLSFQRDKRMTENRVHLKLSFLMKVLVYYCILNTKIISCCIIKNINEVCF